MISKEKELAKITKEILQCKFCLKNKRGLLVVGEGSSNAKIVFVGEAPGKEEIKTGRPFIGRAGKLLRELIALTQISEKDYYILSAVKYLPKNYITPKLKDIEHGKLHLLDQLAVIKPKIIVVLGNTASISLLSEKIKISEDHGKVVTSKNKTEVGLKFFLSYHPAAALYSPKLKTELIKDFKKLKKIITS